MNLCYSILWSHEYPIQNLYFVATSICGYVSDLLVRYQIFILVQMWAPVGAEALTAPRLFPISAVLSPPSKRREKHTIALVTKWEMRPTGHIMRHNTREWRVSTLCCRPSRNTPRPQKRSTASKWIQAEATARVLENMRVMPGSSGSKYLLANMQPAVSGVHESARR